MNAAKLSELGIDLRSNKSGEMKAICPKCGPTRKNKRDRPLSVNIDEGVYHCHNHPCDFSGGVSGDKPKYTRPEPIMTSETLLSIPTQQIFSARGIGPKVIERNRITEKNGWIQFNYFRKGDRINIKSRHTKEKRFMQVKDAEAIFYGLDNLDESGEIVIVEGEFDVLAMNQAGIWNALSIPKGAKDNLDCIRNCFDYFDNDRIIILAVDNDEPGRHLQTNLIQRFGPDRVKLVKWEKTVKDANDHLLRHGPESLKSLVDSAQFMPPEGVKFLHDIRQDMIHGYRHGIQQGEETHFGMDGVYSWYPGQLKVVTGVPGDGKTEFELNLMLVRSIMTGAKWAVFSPEYFPASEFYNGLIQSYLGKGIDPSNQQNYCTLEEYIKALDFIQVHFFYIYPDGDDKSGRHTPENILQICKQLILKYGVKGILIDPFNQMVHDKQGKRDDEYLEQHFGEVTRFSRAYGVNFTYIAHPVKQHKNKDGEYDRVGPYDLSGGAMWYNKMDIICVVQRPHKNHDDIDMRCKCTVAYMKVKNQKRVGTGGEVFYWFDWKTNRFHTGTKSHIEIARESTETEKQTSFLHKFWDDEK